MEHRYLYVVTQIKYFILWLTLLSCCKAKLGSCSLLVEGLKLCLFGVMVPPFQQAFLTCGVAHSHWFAQQAILHTNRASRKGYCIVSGTQVVQQLPTKSSPKTYYYYYYYFSNSAPHSWGDQMKPIIACYRICTLPIDSIRMCKTVSCCVHREQTAIVVQMIVAILKR